jgi:hypothetical protein
MGFSSDPYWLMIWILDKYVRSLVSCFIAVKLAVANTITRVTHQAWRDLKKRQNEYFRSALSKRSSK